MFRFSRITYLVFGILLVFPVCTSVSAQEEVAPAPTISVVPMVAAAKSGDESDDKVTGATLRGRVVYEDSGRPVRYAMVSLLRADEKTSGEFYSGYSAKYVKTDENGEFVIKNVGAGNYYPFVKSEGILNRNSYRFIQKDDREDELFEKITVSGLGEFPVLIRAKRGGAISGRILYADGEAAVGIRVEALKKTRDKFEQSNPYFNETSVGSATTDDRGAYRFSGLPVGQYIVRVIEPVSHKIEKADYAYGYQSNEQSNVLRTYFPEGEISKDAKIIDVERAQEQTEININLPDRRLFSVSGRIVLKKNRQPIKDFEVSFIKISDIDNGVIGDYNRSSSIKTDKEGLWHLKSLPKGKYRVTAFQGYVTRNNEKEKIPEYPPITKEIEIIDKELTEIIFEIPAESSFSGTFTIDGGKDIPSNLNISIINSETGDADSTRNYISGGEKNSQPIKQKTFRIGRILGGKYFLNSNYGEFYVKSATLGGKDILNNPFEIGEGEEVGDAKIVFASDFGKFKGKVENFEPNARFFVVLVKSSIAVDGAPASSFSAAVKAGGEFEIQAAPGEYKAVAVKHSNAPATFEDFKEWLKNTIKNASTVTIRAGETENGNLTAQ